MTKKETEKPEVKEEAVKPAKAAKSIAAGDTIQDKSGNVAVVDSVDGHLVKSKHADGREFVHHISAVEKV